VIQVEPTEPEDEKWKDWKTQAAASARKLKAGDKIDSDLYKGGRKVILDFFHNKCAYCESQLDNNQRYGDVEHYRPKGRVTDAEGQPVYVAGEPHPGYYWLAYDWTNLLPACSACNRPGEHPDLSSSGKYDRFPVVDESKRARTPDDALEPPDVTILINPYLENPADHLVFDDATGFIAPRTTKGKLTIKILGLNRQGLVTARKEAAQAAKVAYAMQTTTLFNLRVQRSDLAADAVRASRDADVAKYERGEQPYCAVALVAIQAARDEGKKAFEG
jgi:hypothetical protein